ncbi:hypothetical protein LAZ67_7001364 [Cordylochernes scorpioides]|uniref:Peptidase A2 domain-containing protein n=1 Tax=Cordylochernes scorpioides TaxID=51811 RepID=A0ABY6KP52_9ARAC|nr:hypothetical protein LAZ67_7001364 [Cordylochernes scorpioides]
MQRHLIREHGIYQWPTFLGMEPLKRRRKVKKLKLCSNCLRNNHSCQGKHNTLIHINATIHQFKENTIGIYAIEEPDKTLAESSVKETNDALGVTSILNTTCLISNQEDSFVLLSTETIIVMNHQGKYQPFRALIDTASQATLITRDCLKKLNLEPSRTRVELAGIGGQILDRPDGVINLNFTFQFNLSEDFKTNAFVSNKVTSLQLADPQYQYIAPIGILLGADIAFYLLKGAIKYGHEGQPKAIKTLLGWLLFGEIEIFQKKSRNYQKLHTFNCTLSINGIQYLSYGKKNSKQNLILCLENQNLKPLTVFFFRIEQILKQQPQVYQTYKDSMKEYLDLGYMNEVKEN